MAKGRPKGSKNKKQKAVKKDEQAETGQEAKREEQNQENSIV